MLKSYFSSLFFLSLLFLLPSCIGQQKKEGLFVVNVLDEEHFQDCHIKNSINLTLDELDDFAKDLDKEKSEIVFYCSNYMCTASGFAAEAFIDKGFANVWAYEAGMAEWYQKELPVTGSCTKAYLEKKMEKSELDESSKIRIISTDELARKMKFIK